VQEPASGSKYEWGASCNIQVVCGRTTALTPYDTSAQPSTEITNALASYATASAVDTRISPAMKQVDTKIAAVPSTDPQSYLLVSSVLTWFDPEFVRIPSS
jgi:hypothetical protein